MKVLSCRNMAKCAKLPVLLAAVLGLAIAPVAWADDDDWGDWGDDPGDDPGMEEPSPGDPEYCAWYGHDYVETMVEEPTCQSPGYAHYECSNCGETWACTLEIVDHDYEDGVCRWCGKLQSGAQSRIHVAAVEPTCTTSGNIEYWKSSNGLLYYDAETGGNLLMPSQVIRAALGHSWSAWTTNTPATCTTAGARTRTCSRPGCGASETETIAKLGHSWSTWTTNTPATCTTAGMKTRTCSRCNASATETIAALGHNWVAGTPVAVTCTEQGYTPCSCSRCGATENHDVVSALGHSWSAWTTTMPATFTSAGEEERSCSRCNAHETREIPILEHSAFTVSASNNKFTISRSDATTVETVLYRTISLSAFAGQHYTSVTGTLTFAVGQTNKTVTVSELTPSTVAYKYQTGTTRSYRF